MPIGTAGEYLNGQLWSKNRFTISGKSNSSPKKGLIESPHEFEMQRNGRSRDDYAFALLFHELFSTSVKPASNRPAAV